MSEEETFDIDIYGDEPDVTQADPQVTSDQSATETHANNQTHAADDQAQSQAQAQEQVTGNPQAIASTNGNHEVTAPRQAPTEQDPERKEGDVDARPVDAGATTALRLGELLWSTTEDDIRGWANQVRVENELINMTFNEHKVNGKSKGYVLILYGQHCRLLTSL